MIVVPDAEEDGAQERIQRVGWDRRTKAWDSLQLPDVRLHHKFRLRFLCGHNLAEVPCGPDGRGYPIEQRRGSNTAYSDEGECRYELGFISGRACVFSLRCVRAIPRRSIGSCKLHLSRLSPVINTFVLSARSIFATMLEVAQRCAVSLFTLVALISLFAACPQASLWILWVAVGTVSNVDLSLNEVLGTAVQATGDALLDGMGT